MALIDNLVAYYKTDTGALTTDSKGSYTLTNLNTVTEGTGIINECGTHVKANQEALYKNADDFGIVFGTGFTISTWYKPTTVPTGASTDTTACISNTWVSPYLEFDMGIAWNVDQAKFYVNYGQSGVANNYYYWAGSPSAGNWYHMVMTWDGSTIKLYVNGTERISEAEAGNGNQSMSDYYKSFWIGGNPSGEGSGTNHANGLIDETALWSVALEQADVTSLYNGGSGYAYPFASAPSITGITSITL